MEHPVYTIQGVHKITIIMAQVFLSFLRVCVKPFALKLILLRILIVEV
jgi:hypothetical protein